MGDWLQTSANIVQVVGGLWVLILGGKTIFDVIKHFLQKKSFRTFLFSPFITNFLSIIILVLVIGTYFRNPFQGTVPEEQSSSKTNLTTQRNVSPTASKAPMSPSPTSLTLASPGTKAVPDSSYLRCSGIECDSDFSVRLNYYVITKDKNRIVFSLYISSGTSSSSHNMTVTDVNFSLRSTMDKEPHQSHVDFPSDYTAELRPGQSMNVDVPFDFVPYQRISYEISIDIRMNAQRIIFEPFTLNF